MNELYFDLLKRVLVRSIMPDGRYEYPDHTKKLPYSHEMRTEGRDWPVEAYTMVGLKRLECLQSLLVKIAEHRIPGDIVECGVWRGGASIFMRGVLVGLGEGQRRSWLYDSFEGLPKPDNPRDVDLTDFKEYLGVSLEQVQEHFRQFGLLSDNVKFVRGWFSDTLPKAEVGKIALLRLDGDMYSSTMETLENLYPKVSTGGFVVVDDYGALEVCRDAIHDYRKRLGITAPITQVDWTGAWWQVG